MKKIFCALLIVLIFGSLAFNWIYNPSNGAYHQVMTKPSLLKDALDTSRDAVFIDLRDGGDYSDAHIDGFINLSFDDELVAINRYLKSKKLTEKSIYLMCYSGNRSAKAFNILSQKGYKNLTYIAFGYEEAVAELKGDFTIKKGECPCKDD